MLSVMGEAGLQDHEEEGGGGGRHFGRGHAGQPGWILVFAPCSRDEGAARRGEGAALWRASSGLVPVPMGVLPYHLPCVLQVTPEILASSSLLLFNCQSISAV